MRAPRPWIALLLAVAPAAPSAAGQDGVMLTVDEALALAFPEAEVVRHTEVLSAAEQRQLTEAAGSPFRHRLVFPYLAHAKAEDGKSGDLLGTAYFDSHRVRSKRETLMVVVAPDGAVMRTEILAFAEPKQYMLRPKWFAQFERERLDDRLRLGGDIRGVTGATLSASAVTDCVRRCLALHALLEARREPQPEPIPEPPPEPTPAPAPGGTGGGGEPGGLRHDPAPQPHPATASGRR